MGHEVQVKRWIYQAKCDCGWADEYTSRPPREVLCPKCRQHWCKYEKLEWVGKDY